MITLPEGCFCEEGECQPLAQIVATNKKSFLTICERKNYKPEDNRDKNDKYKVWFKNDLIDDVQHYDKRDLIDATSVFAQAVSIIENIETNQEDKEV